MFFRLISLFMALSAVVTSAHAAATCTEYSIQGEFSTDWFSDRGAACQALVNKLTQAAQAAPPDYRATYAISNAVAQGGTVCTTKTTPNPKMGGSPSYNDYYYSTRDCPGNNKCESKTGKTGILNFTEGYTRTPDEGDRTAVGGVAKPPADGAFCRDGCTVSAQTSGPGVNFYVSQYATDQGLFRRSADMPFVELGKPCTAATSGAQAAADKAIVPATPPPACPGYVGEVNGKKGCFGTADKPIVSIELDRTTASPQPGNPAAGEKPASGEGFGLYGCRPYAFDRHWR